MRKILIKQLIVKKLCLFILLLTVIFLFPPIVFAQNQEVIIDTSENNNQDSSGPRLETGSVTPQYGPPGEYTFHTYFSDPQNRIPEYVRIYISDINKDVPIEKTQPHLMQRNPSNTNSSWGTEYTYTTNITEEGQYQFYFEAKVGSEIIHNPSYGGPDCKPGLCPDCCGAWGGPKVLSEKLINKHKIYLFDKDKETAIWSYNTERNWVTSVAFSADNTKLAAADNQGNLYLFDIKSNNPIWTYKAEFDPNNGNISQDIGLVAFSQNYYIAASLKGQVFLFKTDNNQPIWKHDIGMTLRGLVISDDGQYIAAGGHDTKVYLWETKDSSPKWEYKIQSEGGILGLEGSVIRTMAMAPESKYFTAGTSCPDRSVYVFSPKKTEPILKIKAGANFPVETIDISDDGQYVIAAGGGSDEDPYSALLIKTDKEEPVWKYDYSKNPAITARISPDGQLIALGYIIDGVYFLQRNSNQPLWLLKNSGYVGDMAFSQEGTMLAVGTGTYHVILLSTDNIAILKDWKTENKVESVAISPNGQYIAAGTSLERFISIGSEGDNTTGAGIGELKDLKPELVKLSTDGQGSQIEGDNTTDAGVSELKSELVEQSEDNQGSQIKKDAVKSFKIPNFYFWIGLFLGIGLIILSLIVFIKKRIRWIIIIVIVGIGFIIISSYYLTVNKKQIFTEVQQKEIQNEDSTDQNIKIGKSYDTGNSNNIRVIE